MEQHHRVNGQADADALAAQFAALLRLAEEYWLRGQDDDAEALLLRLRGEALGARDAQWVAAVEVGLAHFALATDNPKRARRHLEAAGAACAAPPPNTAARRWLAEVGLAAAEDVAPQQPAAPASLFEALLSGAAEPTLLVQLHAAASRQALRGEDVARADHHVQRALKRAPGEDYARALALLAVGHHAAFERRWSAAADAQRHAITLMLQGGLLRPAARAQLHYALRLATRVNEPPAQTLGRARRNFAGHATWRDQAQLRAGFREHGRRLADRILSATVARCVERLGETTGTLRARVASALDQADRAWVLCFRGMVDDMPPEAQHIRDALAEVRTHIYDDGRKIGVVAEELVDAASAALVAHNRMRMLLDELPGMDSLGDAAELGERAALAARRLLDADRVVIARRNDDGEVVLVGMAASASARGNADGDFEPRWRAAVAADPRVSAPPHEEPPARRAPESLNSTDLVAHTRASGIDLLLYADKRTRDGRFGAQDKQLARLLCDYLALALARLAADAERGGAIDRLSATLDAIHDGVISVDAVGCVSGVNRSAARMLGLDAREVLGAHCRSVDVLRPLWRLVERQEHNDDVRVHSAAGQFLVSVRALDATAGAGGAVISLTELDRATRIAQRLTTTRSHFSFKDVITRHAKMRECIALARQAASLEASVLITGESGVGKELIAQAIHSGGPRRLRPFIAINCAAVPRELLEAELFGYEAGAFTGARVDGRLGKFELAGEGTILLDEIGDMPLDMQAKLLRVLQERRLTRLGGAEECPLLARVIATTHRDLDDRVDEGLFRHDLLFRLRVLHIDVLPLRDRGDDVLLIAEQLLKRVARAQYKAVQGFSAEVRDQLRKHDWPGNVRELSNVVEREVSLLAADVSEWQRLRLPLGRRHGPSTAPPGRASALVAAPPTAATVRPLREVERMAFLQALQLCGYNVPRAARALGVSKVTFYAKLRRWGLHPSTHKQAALRRLWDEAAMMKS